MAGLEKYIITYGFDISFPKEVFGIFFQKHTEGNIGDLSKRNFTYGQRVYY